MKKLIVVSLMIATFWIPIAAARDPSKRAGKKVTKRFAAFCAFYVITVLYVLPRL